MSGRIFHERGVTQHKCEALVVSCSDFRFADDLHQFISRNRLLYNSDLLVMPGSAKGIASNSIVRAVDLDRIAALWKLHRFGKVILIHHEDCGAYGGRSAFINARDERRRHREDMRAARTAIEERLMLLAEELGMREEIDVSFALIFALVKPKKTDDFDFEIIEDIDGVLGRPPDPEQPSARAVT